MLILILLLLQQPEAYEFCQSQCNQNSALTICIDCLREQKESIISQSFCNFWNSNSCNSSQIKAQTFEKKLRITSKTDLQSSIRLTNPSLSLSDLLMLNKEILEIPAIFWLFGNYTEVGFDGFLYVHEINNFNSADLMCLGSNKFFVDWEVSTQEFPERLKLDEICHIKDKEISSKNRQLQVTCPTDASCSYCQSSSSNTWIGCTSCPSGLYAYQGFCWTNCPDATTPSSGGTCDITSQTSYYFYDHTWYDDSLKGKNSPCATTPYIDEGKTYYLYFPKCAYLHIDNYVMPYFYVISGWLFLNHISSSWTQIFYWYSDLLHINNNYLELYQDVTDTTSFPLSTWNYFYVARWTDWTNVYFSLSVNGNTEVTASVLWSSYINLVDYPNTLYVGAPPQSTNKVGFSGLLYRFNIYVEYQSSHTTEDYVTDCYAYYNDCTACPTNDYTECLHDSICTNYDCEYCEDDISNHWFVCTSCSSSLYLYEEICYGVCPEGTSADSTNMICTPTSSYSIQFDLAGTISSTPYGWTLDSYSATKIYPFAVLNRGYYFDTMSMMKTTLTMSATYVLTGWINVITTNSAKELSIFTVWTPDFSMSPVYLFMIDHLYPKINNVKNHATAFTANQWIYFCGAAYADDINLYSFVSINHQTFASGSLSLGNYYSPITTGYTWYIGNNDIPVGDGNPHYDGFNGYLYNFHLRNKYSTAYIFTDYETSDCIGSCSACPSSLSCPSLDCGYNQYLSVSGECSTCSSASCYQGCVRETDCIKCLDNCLTCSDFSTCTACNSGYLISPSGNSCLKECPTGSYDNGSSQCVFDSNSGHTFSLTFDHLQGTVPDSVRGINVIAGTTSSFYPDYASDSPIAVKDRGYYFDGTALMQFPLGISVSFGSDFSLSSWIFCPSPQSGVIVSKQVLDPDVIMKFELNGSNTPQLTLFLTLGTGTQTTSPIVSNTAIDGTQWFNLAFSVSFATPHTQVIFYTNGAASPAILSVGAFIDMVTDYSITIGAQRTMSGFVNFFKGYVYSLNSWNSANNPSLIDMTTCSCGICPSTSTGCLPSQGIDKFWDGNTWQSCHANCALSGCVRYDSVCNLCESPSCLVCDDWTGCLLWCDPTCLTCNGPTSSDCILCADPSLVLSTSSGSCICPESNQYIKVNDPLTCAECHPSCATCVGPNYNDCVLCADETFTVNSAHGYCECNSTQFIIARSPIECGECDSSCLTCSEAGKLSCTSCPPGLTLNEDGSCSCGFGILQDSECVQCNNPTCKACLSSSDNCVACHSPRVLEGNSCNCPLGMKELFGGCVLSSLSIAEEYSSSTVYFAFNEDLSEALSDQDLNITVLSEYQIATYFKVKQISLSSYEVSVTFSPSYSSINGTLNVYITSQKYGVSGSALQNRFFKHNVSSTNNDEQQAMDFVAGIIPRATQTAVATSVIVYGAVSYIMLRKSTTLWTYVNMVQIIAFIPLQNIKIPSDLFNMFKGFISYTWLPNFGELVYGNANAGNAPLSRFSKYGYNSGLFLISAGGMITLVLAVLILWHILWLAKVLIKNQKIKTMLETKVLVNFKYNWLLRLMVEVYILAFCGVVIGMNNVNGTRPDFIIDFILSWIFFLLSLYLNFIIFWVIWKNKEKIVLKDEGFKKKYPILVAEFHCEKGILSMCYYPWFVLRRTIFILTLYNLADVPILQSMVNAVCSLITLAFLAKYKPYKDKYDNQVEMVTEIFIASLFVDVTPYVDDNLSVAGREACQLIAILGMLFFLLYSYILLAYRIILKIKNRKKNKDKADPVSEIVPPINNEEDLSSEKCELAKLSHTSREGQENIETSNRLIT